MNHRRNLKRSFILCGCEPLHWFNLVTSWSNTCQICFGTPLSILVEAAGMNYHEGKLPKVSDEHDPSFISSFHDISLKILGPSKVSSWGSSGMPSPLDLSFGISSKVLCPNRTGYILRARRKEQETLLRLRSRACRNVNIIKCPYIRFFSHIDDHYN